MAMENPLKMCMSCSCQNLSVLLGSRRKQGLGALQDCLCNYSRFIIYICQIFSDRPIIYLINEKISPYKSKTEIYENMDIS